MDRRILILALVVAASGCADTSTSTSKTGLAVTELSISDRSLAPGQTGLVTLKVKNFHPVAVDLDGENISMYNTGPLKVVKQGCSPDSLKQPRKGYNPGMECNWEVSVPEKKTGIETKTIPTKINIAYRSNLSNSKHPIKVHVMPLEDIRKTADVKKKFSNGEVEMTVETESPVPLQGRTVELTARNVGSGRLSSNFSFSYFPETLLSKCPEEPEQVVSSEVTFTCELKPETASGSTRNLIFSTSYKYVKAPTLNIGVVNRE